MRFRTKRMSPNRVRHSYYVTFLLWLGERLWTHGESIASKHFD